MEEYKIAEKSIITTYRNRIWKPFVAAINEYKLISEGDKIAVCISGGKDSMLLAKCMQEIKRHGKMNFELVFLVMNPGYNKANLNKILENSKKLNIPITVFDSDIFDIVSEVKQSPCYLCARMRRGCLYSKAREFGCNKIALGHHFDDVIETLLLSVLYNGQINTMMPKLHSTNFEGMELIRPLYKVKEKDVINWKNYNNLDFIQCACRFTENCSLEEASAESTSKRKQMKFFIQKLREINPLFDENIFNSLNNVCLDTILGYKKNKQYYSFLDDYDKI